MKFRLFAGITIVIQQLWFGFLFLLFTSSFFSVIQFRASLLPFNRNFVSIYQITSDHMNDRNKIIKRHKRAMLVVWYIFECRSYLYVSPCLFFFFFIESETKMKWNEKEQNRSPRVKSHLPTINLITKFSFIFYDLKFHIWSYIVSVFINTKIYEREKKMNK